LLAAAETIKGIADSVRADGGADLRLTTAMAPVLVLPRVFEPFYSTKTRGTGLGLALARRLVERMGGTLSLENGEATGAVARLHLPA